MDTFFIPEMRFAVGVGPVDPVGDAQRRPQSKGFVIGLGKVDDADAMCERR